MNKKLWGKGKNKRKKKEGKKEEEKKEKKKKRGIYTFRRNYLECLGGKEKGKERKGKMKGKKKKKCLKSRYLYSVFVYRKLAVSFLFEFPTKQKRKKVYFT